MKNLKTKNSASPGMCPLTKEKCNKTECANRIERELAKLKQLYDFYENLQVTAYDKGAIVASFESTFPNK